MNDIPWGALILALFLFVGLAMLGYALFALQRSHQAASWPTASGRIASSGLQITRDEEGNSYRAKVTYVYSVGGRDYTSDQVAFGYMGSGARDYHERITDKLPKGTQVVVHYDPKRPEKAVLAHGINKSIVFLLMFGTLWTVVILTFVAMVWQGGGPSGQIADKIEVLTSKRP